MTIDKNTLDELERELITNSTSDGWFYCLVLEHMPALIAAARETLALKSECDELARLRALESEVIRQVYKRRSARTWYELESMVPDEEPTT